MKNLGALGAGLAAVILVLFLFLHPPTQSREDVGNRPAVETEESASLSSTLPRSKFKADHKLFKTHGSHAAVVMRGRPADFPDWKQLAFAEELAALLGIGPQEILITGLRRGSVVAELEFSSASALRSFKRTSSRRDSESFTRFRHEWLLDQVSFRWKDRTPPFLEQEPLAGSKHEAGRIFLSYHHKESKFMAELKKVMAPLQRNLGFDLWCDRDLRHGGDTEENLERSLARAKMAVLFVSPEFLACDFIQTVELPMILKKGVRVFWIPIRESLVEEVTELSSLQAAWASDLPVADLSRPKRDKAWVKIARLLGKHLKDER